MRGRPPTSPSRHARLPPGRSHAVEDGLREVDAMLQFILDNPVQFAGYATGSLLLGALLIVLAGGWIIGEQESGLVIKKFGQPLPPGRLIALNGEAGYQARLLSPGWHFGLWRWQYKVARIPVVQVRP